MTTNINIDSKHAVRTAIAWKGPTYFVLIFFTIVFCSYVPGWISYSRMERERFTQYTKIKSMCEQAQLEKYGQYDSLQCSRIANVYYPVYR